MKKTIVNGVQVSTSIVSKAKWALGITEKKPKNKITCSKQYWTNIVVFIASSEGLEPVDIQRATDMRFLYDKSRLNMSF